MNKSLHLKFWIKAYNFDMGPTMIYGGQGDQVQSKFIHPHRFQDVNVVDICTVYAQRKVLDCPVDKSLAIVSLEHAYDSGIAWLNG